MLGCKPKCRLRLPGSLTKPTGILAAGAIRAWMSTLDYRAAFYDQSVDPVFGAAQPRIYVFWHEYILAPLHLRGHCHLTMLLSQHRDGEMLAHVATKMGFNLVRGSTYRGAARAIWELSDRSRSEHLTITPDGPRGPRRCLAQGPIYLASRLDLPLVAMGFGYDRPWRLNSWDHFAVPRPFTRARAVIGPSMILPPKLDRGGIEQCRQRVESLLNDLTREAESWATAGSRKAGEVAIRPQAAPPAAGQQIHAPAFGTLASPRAA